MDTGSSNSQRQTWTTAQIYILAIVCLLVGSVGGYFLRGSASPSKPAATSAVSAEHVRAGAEAALPMVEQLKRDPKNFKLLVATGEMYYNHGEFAEAGTYYARALEVEDNPAVRNKYASTLFYTGNADGAVEQYAKVLQADPKNEIALFNSGMVRFTGKNDRKGAIEMWKKLLAAYPKHSQREQVERMIQRASGTQG